MSLVEGTIGQRIWLCVRRALPKAARTCLWLLKIILPVSLAYAFVVVRIKLLVERLRANSMRL